MSDISDFLSFLSSPFVSKTGQYAQAIGPGMPGMPGASSNTPLPDTAGRGLLNDSSPTSDSGVAPPPTPQTAWNTAQPQVPTFQQFQQNQRSLPGILSSFGQGYLPGLSTLLGGDQNTQAAQYNAMLGQGQTVGMQGLQIPNAQWRADLMSGKIDPQTGQYRPGYGPMAPQQQQQNSPYIPPVPGPGAQPGGQPSGIMAGPGAPQPQGGQPMPQGAVQPQYQPQGAPGQGGGPAAYGAPAQATGDKFLNLPLPRGVSTGAAMSAYALDPTGKILNEMIGKALTLQNVRPGGAAVDSYGNVVYQQPNLPQGQVYQQGQNGAPGQAITIPGANPQHAALQNIDQNAILGRERAMARTNYGIEYGGGPDSQGDGPQQPPPPTSGVPTGNPTTAAHPAPLGTPSARAKTAPVIAPLQGVVSPRDTTIPSPAEAAPVNGSAAYLRSRMPQWAETENDWGKAIDTNQQAEQRILAIGSALQKTQSGQFATDKADIKAKLAAVGIELPKEVWGDPGQVQIALKDNFTAALQQVKAFSSRGTQMEVLGAAKNFANPDLQPEANQAILAQALGSLQRDRNMMQDWQLAKRMQGPGGVHWQDPQDFNLAWSQKNPLEGFVDRATKQIGPLMGQPGAPGSAPAPATLKPMDGPTKQAAQSALMRGKDRNAVIQRLKEKGFDASGL